MAKPPQLDSTPDVKTNQPEEKETPQPKIAEAIQKQAEKKEEPEQQLVSLEEYEALLKERPRKLTPEQVGFQKGGGKEEYPCSSCFHFYRGMRHNTCEIVRTPDDQIDLLDRCLFWTQNRKDYPLLEEE
jgi:hypothetical protein